MTPGRWRACLFDLYDTLVYFDVDEYQQKAERIGQMCGVPPTLYLSAWKALVVPSNLGTFATTEDRVVALLERLCVATTPTLVSSVATEEHRFLRDSSHLFPDTLDTLASLAESGIALGLVTNASPSVQEVLTARRLAERFEATIISSALGVRKPDLRIYEACLRQMGVSAAHSLFVGDGNDRELEGAKAAGMGTVLVTRSSFRAFESEQSATQSVDFVITQLADLLPIAVSG